jgi:hypothetical protein
MHIPPSNAQTSDFHRCRRVHTKRLRFTIFLQNKTRKRLRPSSNEARLPPLPPALQPASDVGFFFVVEDAPFERNVVVEIPSGDSGT